MNETEEKIITYMAEKYNRTKWPFMYLSDVVNHLGFFPKNELNNLFKQGKITVHPGIRGTILKLNINA